MLLKKKRKENEEHKEDVVGAFFYMLQKTKKKSKNPFPRSLNSVCSNKSMTNNLLVLRQTWIDFQTVDVVQSCLHPIYVIKEKRKFMKNLLKLNLTRESHERIFWGFF